jgi:hypothetical protein
LAEVYVEEIYIGDIGEFKLPVYGSKLGGSWGVIPQGVNN